MLQNVVFAYGTEEERVLDFGIHCAITRLRAAMTQLHPRTSPSCCELGAKVTRQHCRGDSRRSESINGHGFVALAPRFIEGLADVSRQQRTVSTVFWVEIKKKAPMSVHSYSRRDIAAQKEHHRKRTFMEDYESLVERYGLRWVEEETVKTVSDAMLKAQPPR